MRVFRPLLTRFVLLSGVLAAPLGMVAMSTQAGGTTLGIAPDAISVPYP